MIVEDEDALRAAMALTLADDGFQVYTAEHGAAALSMLDRTRPDLILLDLSMPVMDGPTFLERYRERPGPHAPVIVCSTRRDDRDLGRYGVVARLSKPFEIDDLIECVSTLAKSDGPEPAGPTIVERGRRALQPMQRRRPRFSSFQRELSFGK